MIVNVLLNQDLRYGIDGLIIVLKQKRMSPKSEEDMTMFVNSSKRMVKIMWGGRYLFTARKNKGESKFTAADFKKLASFFKDGFMKPDQAKRLNEFIGNELSVVDDGTGMKVG